LSDLSGLINYSNGKDGNRGYDESFLRCCHGTGSSGNAA
jgi:hypothetical protein